MARGRTRNGAGAGGRDLGPSTVMPIEALVPHPDNARRGDIELLAESLSAHGQYAPIVVQVSTRYVLRGNHLLAAATMLGWTELWVQLVDVDDEQALRILLLDNRSTDNSGYVFGELLDLLGSLPTLDATGYNDHDLAELLAQLDANDDRAIHGLDDELEGGVVDTTEGNEEGDARERRARRDSRMRLGDVLALGGHRIICGDPRDVFAWESVLAGETANMLIVHADSLDVKPVPREIQIVAGALATADRQLEPGAAIVLFRHHDARGVSELAALADRFRFLQEAVHLHEPDTTTAPFAMAHTPIALARKLVGPKKPARKMTTGSTSVWTGESPTAVAICALTDVGAAVAVLYARDAEALLVCEGCGRTAYLLQPNPRLATAVAEAWQEAGGEPPRRRN